MQWLWTEKHAPQNWSDFVGNSAAVERVKQWASSWQSGKPQKPLLLYGPVGNGKTTLALLCAKVMGWQVFEMNASDFRTKELVQRFAGSASQGASLFGTLRLILLDEVDGLQAQDKGGAEAIAEILKESRNPVILTANDIYANKKLALIRANCELVKMDRPHSAQIQALLKKICLAEKVEFEDSALALLAKRSSGDIRSAILDLQTLAMRGKITASSVEQMSYREREENIFTVLAMIMRAKTFAEVRSARARADVDDEMLAAWLSENIPLQFDAQDTATALNYFSLGDVFEGRILKRQYFGLKRYASDLAIACSVLSRSKDYHGWVKYQFPKVISELSMSMQQRATKSSICKKIGRLINESAKSVASNEFPLIAFLFTNERHAAMLTAAFGFDEKEVAFLLGNASDKKVQEILEEAEKIRQSLVASKQLALKPKAEGTEKRRSSKKRSN